MTPWPRVLPNDGGIRPAGPPDKCFYCFRKVGEEHTRDCVTILKKVRLRYIFIVEVEVPHSWTPEDILFLRNESSWCADNALEELDKVDDRTQDGQGCCCHRFRAEFVEVVDDTPRREEW